MFTVTMHVFFFLLAICFSAWNTVLVIDTSSYNERMFRSRTNRLMNVAIVYSERRLSANECRPYMSETNLLSNVFCELFKANCVTTNETVYSDSLCLMWPHGLSVWRNDGRLVSTACANQRWSNRRSGDRFCRQQCRHAGISIPSGRCHANRRERRRFDSVFVVVVQCVA